MNKNGKSKTHCPQVILAVLMICALGIFVTSGCSKFRSATSNTNANPSAYEADGSEITINGTITALSNTSITIKKDSGGTVTAAIGKATPVLVRSNDGKKVQSLAAVNIGDKVSAGVRREGGKQVVVGLGITK